MPGGIGTMSNNALIHLGVIGGIWLIVVLTISAIKP